MSASTLSAKPLLEAKGLVKRFPVRRGVLQRPQEWVTAVDGVSLTAEPGRTLGIVGESGCGKSTLGRIVLGLLKPDSGQVVFEGRDLAKSLKQNASDLRRKIQTVFQDPLESLDPRWPVGRSIAEPLALLKLTRKETESRVHEALESVQLPAEISHAFPHELSGGQRQRVGIARAIIVRPSFVVCDEAVSSLDVSIRGQVLALLADLQKKQGMAYWFISHDLAVVKAISQRVAVMYLGRVVELGPAQAVFETPWHPYTEALLAAVPTLEKGQAPLRLLPGEPPSARAIPSGCRFRTRCPLAQPRCAAEDPPLEEKQPGRWVACHFRP